MICILLIDEHGAICEGLALLFRRAGLGSVRATSDAQYAVALAETRRPDVIVLDPDLVLGDEGQEGWLARLHAAAPDARILINTSMQEPGALEQFMNLDVDGVVLKTCSADELLTAVRAVADGRRYVDPHAAELANGSGGEDLSCREREVLELLAAGLTGEQAAAQLFLSPETVRTHVRNAMRKLEAPTRARAVIVALKTGLISAELASSADGNSLGP